MFVLGKLLQPSLMFARDKHSSLLKKSVNYSRNKFYDTGPLEVNGTARFKKNINNCLNTNIYSYLEISGGQSSNPYLNVVHFYNTRVD